MDREVRPAGSWATAWRAWYRLLRLGGPAIAAFARRTGFGNLVVLRVSGRRSRRERSLPLGLLTVEGRRYVGHPNGDTAWTLNLAAAGRAVLECPGERPVAVRPVRLPAGRERDAVVRTSFRQHPFPGNALYRLSGAHVQAYGAFFRLEADEPAGSIGRGRRSRTRAPERPGPPGTTSPPSPLP